MFCWQSLCWTISVVDSVKSSWKLQCSCRYTPGSVISVVHTRGVANCIRRGGPIWEHRFFWGGGLTPHGNGSLSGGGDCHSNYESVQRSKFCDERPGNEIWLILFFASPTLIGDSVLWVPSSRGLNSRLIIPQYFETIYNISMNSG